MPKEFVLGGVLMRRV